MVTAAANVPPVTPSQLRAFVRRLCWRRRLSLGIGALLRALLALLVPAVALLWLFPAAVATITLVVAAVLLFAALGGLVSAAGARAALLRGIDQVSVHPAVLADLDDELRTWLEDERPAQSPAMRAWLGNDVCGRLATLPAAALRPIGRRSPGRLWWCLPLLLLVLLAWWLSWWLAPPWPGALGGAANQPAAAGGAGGERGDGHDGRGQDERREPEPPPRPRDEARSTPPLPPPPSAATPPPDDEPSPLLALPEQQHFVLPEFIDDGPTRRARMRAAELEAGAPAQPTAAGLGDGKAPPPPPPRDELFERAAEAAQRARHVPPAEQAMVRRFFDRLREAGR